MENGQIDKMFGLRTYLLHAPPISVALASHQS